MALLSGYLRNARLAKILPHIRGVVLDVGCQWGQLRDQARAQIDEYAGIDMNKGALERARETHPDCEFKLLNIDDESLGYEDKFDTIIMSAVIEHLFNLKHVGKELARALRPGGRIVFTTPTPFGNDIVHYYGSQIGLFSKDAADDHIVIFNRKRFEILAGECGLRLVFHKRFQLGCNQIAILERQAD